jgi:hypothetical protein
MSVGTDELEFNSSAVGSSAGGANTGTPYSNAKGAFIPNIADVDRLAGGTVYRKWFLENIAPVDSLISPSVWIQGEPRYMTEHIGLGFDSSDDTDSAQGNMTAFGANAVVALVSSAADTRTATIWGLNASGSPLSEDVVLNGTSEVLSVATFSKVYAVMLSATNAGLTVTVKQGTGGTTRGTIGPSKKCCWLWVEPLNKGAGIRLPDLAAGSNYGFWDRITWAPAVSGVRPNISVIAVEEN